MQGILQGEVGFEEALTKLLPRQKDFIFSPEKFTAYIGGVGSGKTIAGCLSMIMLGQAIPNSLWLVGRLNYPALRDTTRRSFLELFPQEWLAPKGWKESENRLIAKNGSEYLFRHLDISDTDQQRTLMSLNLNGFFMDEATECSEKVFLTLDSRLRRKTNPKGHFGRLCGNPAGQDWIYRRFFKPDRAKAMARLHRGIIAPTTENIHLDDTYISDKLATWPQDWIDRYIHGSFSDFSDLVYKEWDYNVHVYSPTRKWPFFDGNFDAPQEWPTIIGIDIGGVDPWCWLFIKVAPNGMLFVFDEIYMPHVLVRVLAERYYEIMDGHHFEGMAYDYENQQASFELQDLGITGQPAVKDRKPGIFKVAQYIHLDRRLVNPFTGQEGSPRLFVSENCPNLIREISSYKWAKDRAGEVTGDAADGNDHSVDALRYAIHTFRPEPEKLKPVEKWENKELNELSRMFWRDVALNESRTKRRGKRYFSYSPVVIR